MMKSLDGWLIINKDIGVTSRHIVNIIKKTLNVKKVGHAGTLDPAASGILVIAVGKAILSSKMMNGQTRGVAVKVRDSLKSQPKG